MASSTEKEKDTQRKMWSYLSEEFMTVDLGKKVN
jgi:hypothetical protein